jgi:hypothetical protein
MRVIFIFTIKCHKNNYLKLRKRLPSKWTNCHTWKCRVRRSASREKTMKSTVITIIDVKLHYWKAAVFYRLLQRERHPHYVIGLALIGPIVAPNPHLQLIWENVCHRCITTQKIWPKTLRYSLLHPVVWIIAYF